MSNKTYKISIGEGIKVEVTPKLFLYEVSDFLERQMKNIGIKLLSEEDGESIPFSDLTKSFGEFIGFKNTAYIDTNNNPFATQLLELGIAQDTGLYKSSGLCNYPLWLFDEDFLKEIGGEEYEKYCQQFDDGIGISDEPNDEDEDYTEEEPEDELEVKL